MNPFLGVFFHWMGGLAAGSFYAPFKSVRKWSWETYWLVGGFFSWIVAPWIAGSLMTHDLFGVLSKAPPKTIFWAWFFGLLWGVGGLTFGLTMRYLGMALGYGVALGVCAVCGTLLPPLFRNEFGNICTSVSGRITLAGIGICILGICFTALAGLSKERELSAEAKKSVVQEFNFRRGVGMALLCGLMSACMAFGLDAAAPLAELSATAGTPKIWTGLAKLVVVLTGGFTSNALWCLCLHFRNNTGHEYFSSRTTAGEPVPYVANIFLCALAGVTWYFQFFFYTMGEIQMGRFGFSSWTLHMASIIIFSTIWGVAFREWRGTSRRTHKLIAVGLITLIMSTVIIGYGTYLKASLVD